jgi:hypothetical protein
MRSRPRYRYLCPNCGAWHWSAQYRTSVAYDCPGCPWQGRHYRAGTWQARRDRDAVVQALAEAHRAPPPEEAAP